MHKGRWEASYPIYRVPKGLVFVGRDDDGIPLAKWEVGPEATQAQPLCVPTQNGAPTKALEHVFHNVQWEESVVNAAEPFALQLV